MHAEGADKHWQEVRILVPFDTVWEVEGLELPLVPFPDLP